jgi:hypothetical protein
MTALFTPIAQALGGAFLLWGLPWQSPLWVVFGVLAAMLVTGLLSPETPGAGRSRVKVDWAGAIGLGLWSTCLMMALTEGPNDGWGSSLVVGLGVAAAVIFVLWIIQQRLAKVPLMSFGSTNMRQTIVGYTALIFIGVTAPIMFLSVSVMLQTPTGSGWGLGLSPFRATLPMIGSSIGALGAGNIVNFLVPRFGPKKVLAGAAASSLICWLGMAFAHSAYWEYWVWAGVFGLTVITAWGTGFWLIAASTNEDNTAISFGVEYVLFTLASAFATAIALDLISHGTSGYTSQGAWTRLFVGAAVVAVVAAVGWAALAPGKLRDQLRGGGDNHGTATAAASSSNA